MKTNHEFNFDGIYYKLATEDCPSGTRYFLLSATMLFIELDKWDKSEISEELYYATKAAYFSGIRDTVNKSVEFMRDLQGEEKC